MKLLKKLLVFILILVVIPIGCHKEEQLPVDNLVDNAGHERTLKNGDHTAFLEKLISNIEVLIADATLNTGNGNALIVKINAAIKSLDKGNSNAANNQLSAFINQVEAFIQNGTITSDQAIVLIEAAEQAIEGDFSLIVYGSIIDARDGQEYITVKIGDQWWMAENLAYLPLVNVSSDGSDSEPRYYVYDYEGTSVSDAKATSNYNDYGVHYNWEAAKAACPSEWHLPSDEEFTILTDYLGDDAGKKMKSTSGWYNNGNGDNSSGFNALPGGYRDYGGGFYRLGNFAYFWSSSPHESSIAWERHLYYNHDGVYRHIYYRRNGFSVRCIKN